MAEDRKTDGGAAKPNCYNCIHRGEVPGSAHSCCKHPSAGGGDALGRVLSTFASVGRSAPHVNIDGATALGIKANSHGIRRGWFNWPYNFDPTWLEACNGFAARTQANAEKDC